MMGDLMLSAFPSLDEAAQEAATKQPKSSLESRSRSSSSRRDTTSDRGSLRSRSDSDSDEEAKADKKKATALASLANSYAAKEDYKAALSYYTEAIFLNSSDYRFYCNRSFCFEKLGDYEKALSDADQAVMLGNRRQPKSFFRKGRALLGLRRYEDSEEAFEMISKLGSHCEATKAELLNVRFVALRETGFDEEMATLGARRCDTISDAFDFLVNIEVISLKSEEKVKESFTSAVQKGQELSEDQDAQEAEEERLLFQKPQMTVYKSEKKPHWLGNDELAGSNESVDDFARFDRHPSNPPRHGYSNNRHQQSRPIQTRQFYNSDRAYGDRGREDQSTSRFSGGCGRQGSCSQRRTVNSRAYYQQDERELMNGCAPRSSAPTYYRKSFDLADGPTNLFGYKGVWMSDVHESTDIELIRSIFRRFGYVLNIRFRANEDGVFVSYDNTESPRRAIGELIDQSLPELTGRSQPAYFRFTPTIDQTALNFSRPIQPRDNNSECYFWRTTGCRTRDECTLKHILVCRGVDYQPWMRGAWNSSHIERQQ